MWAAAVTMESTTLNRTGGLALRVRNASAIPMRIAVKQAPEWLVLTPPLQLPAESAAIIRPQLTRDAPAGDQQVELALEVTNLHTGPGRNLVVKVPLTIR